MKQGRVLLADKHQNMLEGIRSLLDTLFETVVMVADERSLFEAAERLQADLAVVDLSLPVFEEANVARGLKKRCPDLKLIITSVHDDLAVVNEALAAGALGFVLKRSVVTDLIPAVQVVLRGRTYVSPAINYRSEEFPAAGERSRGH